MVSVMIFFRWANNGRRVLDCLEAEAQKPPVGFFGSKAGGPRSWTWTDDRDAWTVCRVFAPASSAVISLLTFIFLLFINEQRRIIVNPFPLSNYYFVRRPTK